MMSNVWLRRYGVYVLRLYWERRTYRTAMALGAVTSFVGLAQFAMLGFFLQRGGSSFADIQQYGGSVVAYLLSGTVFTGFVTVALHGLTGCLRQEQVAGTIEAVADSPSGIGGLMALSAAVRFIGTVTGSIVMLGAFSLLLGFRLGINVAAVAISIGLTIIVLGGFGMAGCGVVLVTKKGDPITWTILTSMTLLSGVLYPITILPHWLQDVARVLPTTTGLDLLRRSLLSNTSVTAVAASALPLVLWAAVSVPLGVILLRWGLSTSRKRGSIGQF